MKKILINHTQKKTRAVVIEDGVLVSYYVNDAEDPQLIGNIYKGRVQNVLQGMQAAFIDIGMEKNAFLQFGKKHVPDLSFGDDVLVQVDKEAVGTKGPRVTMSLSMPGRRVVLLPNSKSIGVSHKVDEEDRSRLFQMASELRPEGCGLIMRTSAAECPEDILMEEIDELYARWQSIDETARKKRAPALVYNDNDLLRTVVREELDDEVEMFSIDNLKMYLRAVAMTRELMPHLTERLEKYEGSQPIFNSFGVEEEIKKIGTRELELPSGGAIVIDHTEAMTVIDVNTGKFYGGNNLSETVFQTNLEAAGLILRQLKLRDISGIIIVDFIDMNRIEQREQLLRFLRETARGDRKRVHVIDMTPLGLVEITRRNSR